MTLKHLTHWSLLAVLVLSLGGCSVAESTPPASGYALGQEQAPASVTTQVVASSVQVANPQIDEATLPPASDYALEQEPLPARATAQVVTLPVQVANPQSDQTLPPLIPAEEQPEVMTRGPVHEAFAEPVTVEQESGLVAPEEPPDPIDELPPATKPEGQGYVWAPGYWAWDTDRDDYVWVSGCWRVAPPKMYWMPGYWTRVPGGWEWVSGFWASVSDEDEIDYLPAPPETVDAAPPTTAPSPDRIWVPPCWYWRDGRYVLRSGYWMVALSDWVWVPSHYVWTPRGYVFVAGHWDYPLDHRGVLFAPVYFSRRASVRVRFVFSPSVVVNLGSLRLSLFAYPRYCHYYFGDYFDTVYLGIGIYPWCNVHRRHRWYDPIYEHDRWRHRHDHPRWAEDARHNYELRRRRKDLRPPRTWRDLKRRLARGAEVDRHGLRSVQTLESYTSENADHTRFERVSRGGRIQFRREADEVRRFGNERRTWETRLSERRSSSTTREERGERDRDERVSRTESGRESVGTIEERGRDERTVSRELNRTSSRTAEVPDRDEETVSRERDRASRRTTEEQDRDRETASRERTRTSTRAIEEGDRDEERVSRERSRTLTRTTEEGRRTEEVVRTERNRTTVRSAEESGRDEKVASTERNRASTRTSNARGSVTRGDERTVRERISRSTSRGIKPAIPRSVRVTQPERERIAIPRSERSRSEGNRYRGKKLPDMPSEEDRRESNGRSNGRGESEGRRRR